MQMPKFSATSLKKLEFAHPLLQELFHEVIKEIDCTIIETHRNQKDQDADYASGASKLKWPNSKHNSMPSLAVDAAPYPIDWKNTQRFLFFSGIVLGIAAKMGIKVRWGGDWDGDKQIEKDENDFVHFELLDTKKRDDKNETMHQMPQDNGS